MKAKSFSEQLAEIIAEGEMILAAESFAAEHADHVSIHYTIVCDTHGGVGLYDNINKAYAAWDVALHDADSGKLPCEYRILPIISEKK